MTEQKSQPSNKKRNLFGAVSLIILVAFAVTTYWFFFMRGIVSTDDARLDGDLVDIASQIAGSLENVLVKEGDKVTSGQLLFILDRKLPQATLDKAQAAELTARARLASAEAELTKLRSGNRPRELLMAESDMQRAKAALDLAMSDSARTEELFKRNATSAAERDRAVANRETARQAYEKALEYMKLMHEGAREEDIQAAEANVQVMKAQVNEAEAAVRQARLNLGYCEVRAPFDGLVVRKWQDPGAILQAGRQVLTLFDPSTLYISANIEEKYLSRVRVGDPVAISVDAYPGLKLTGRLDKILLATNSQFSLIPSEGVSGAFIKVAQRVPLRIALDSGPTPEFAPGLSVELNIVTKNHDYGTAAASTRNE